MLKFYKKYLEKMFSDLSVATLTSRIIELLTNNPPLIEVDPPIVTTFKKWADDNYYTVSLESNNKYKSDSLILENQLYIPLSLQINDSLNFLT